MNVSEANSGGISCHISATEQCSRGQFIRPEEPHWFRARVTVLAEGFQWGETKALQTVTGRSRPYRPKRGNSDLGGLRLDYQGD